MADAAPANLRPNRMSRQKQKTRNALIGAALSVMARKGVDAATINDITEAADVGFGSFYNHFSSKEDIFGVVTEELLDSIGKCIDKTTETIDDPWDQLATSVRLFVKIIHAKPEWGQFIIRICAVPNYMQFGIFQRLFRDIEKVNKAPNSTVVDPVTAQYAVGGAMVFMVIALLEGSLPIAGAANRISAAVLRTLGQNEDSITKLIARPLPKIGEISLED